MQCSVCAAATTEILLRNAATHETLAICSEACAIAATGQMLPIDAAIADAFTASLVEQQQQIGGPRMQALARLARRSRAVSQTPQFKAALAEIVRLAKYALRHGAGTAPSAPVAGGKRDRFERLVRTALRKLGVLIVSTGETATDATLGTASFGIPTDKVADVIFIALDAGIAAFSAGSAIRGLLGTLRELGGSSAAMLDSFALGGPAEVARQMGAMMAALGPYARQFADRVRDSYAQIVDTVGHMMASALETVAGMFGAVRAAVDTFVQLAGVLDLNRPFSVMARLFAALPDGARNLLQSRDALTAMIKSIVGALLRMFPARDASTRRRLVATAKRAAGSTIVALPLLVLPVTTAPTAAALLLGNMGFASSRAATAWVHGKIETVLLPNAERIAKICQRSMSLVYALLYVLEYGGSSADSLPAASPRELAAISPSPKSLLERARAMRGGRDSDDDDASDNDSDAAE
jgi:hypothetical protein